MSDSDIEMASYPETPPRITPTNPESPKTPAVPDNGTPSSISRTGKPVKPRPSRACRDRASSSSSLSLGDRFATPIHRAGHRVTRSITPSRIQRHRPAANAHQRAQSFEHFLSSTRHLTQRNPSNDENIMVGFANGSFPVSGPALAPTSRSVLGESPPLPRRQDMRRLEQRIDALQIAPPRDADQPQPSKRREPLSYAISAWPITTQTSSKRPCEEPEQGASPIGHWWDGSD
ncbi:hypothetical protein FGADI_10491 [Fusarium gaditjirri]|uniref:Uncharacterized protein n=1 Tax=Fusarium gaditjirri TaxID=282569 RepID=A0A8H4WRH1_9HYPO|nr:hypothetical protein FGADI_10491 [Fusarium gaditjirri]